MCFVCNNDFFTFTNVPLRIYDINIHETGEQLHQQAMAMTGSS